MLSGKTFLRSRNDWSLIRKIISQAESLEETPLEVFQAEVRAMRFRVQSGEPFQSILVSSFAHAFEAIRRVLGLTPYPVQILGGLTMSRGGIAEMQTGEGKTITAIFSASLFSLAGKGCHVITTNDYLAERDANELQRVYEMMGLSVGCILDKLETDPRRLAYSRDITYGTSNQIGFDFLRDRIRLGADVAFQNEDERHYHFRTGEQETLVQRGQFCAIVDEADSVLIDDAKTPLIIGTADAQSAAMVSLFRWCDRVVDQLNPKRDYVMLPRERKVILTEDGVRHVAILDKPRLSDTIDSETFLEHLERTLECRLYFVRDRHYTILEDEIVLVDESTGRIMEGRKLQAGLHHCLEAKEGLPISAATKTAASITVQAYFRSYRYLAGMTGTIWSVRKEVNRTYRLKVEQIPTHRPCVRTQNKTRIFLSMKLKYEAIVKDAQSKISQGRPVLIGTPSVGASELLAPFFDAAEIPYQILNARYEEQEAEIVSDAAQSPCVTIATNMAGRGTDIKLSEEVQKAGGMHVIATEMHSSMRIDRQLVGRCARQGDPGSFQFFLSLEDELFLASPEHLKEAYLRRAKASQKEELSSGWTSLFKKLQRRIERLHKKQRKQMLKQEEKQLKIHRRVGINPYLEVANE